MTEEPSDYLRTPRAERETLDWTELDTLSLIGLITLVLLAIGGFVAGVYRAVLGNWPWGGM
jgi:hypothetical protein